MKWAAVLLVLVGCGRPSGVEGFVGFLDAVHPAGPFEGRLDPPAAPTTSRALAHVLGAAGDAHLALGRPEPAGPVLTPLIPYATADAVYVDASTADLPRGTELVSIEGRPAREVLDTMRAWATVDGEPGLRSDLEVLRSYPAHARTLFGAQDSWSFVVRPPGEEARALALDGVSTRAVEDLLHARHTAARWDLPREVDELWPHWAPPTEGDARRLRLPSFGLPDHEAYAARVDDLLAELEPGETLILDLRGNVGGFRGHGVAVLRHLLDQPFAQWSSVQTRVRRIPRAYRRHLSFPIVPEDALRTFPGEPLPDGSGWRLDGDPLASRMKPHGDGHDGPIDVFIDDATSSAAVELLAALIAARPDVRLFGVETQGGCASHQGEVPAVYAVDAEHRVMLSLWHITLVPTPRCRAGHGFEPDVRIVPSIDDLDGEDPFLEAWRDAAR